MNEWELTDEELYQAWRAAPEHEEDRSIAEAAQKKLVEWLNSPKRTFFNGKEQIIVLTPKQWQALCKGVE